MSVREVSCIRDPELGIATLLLSVVQMISSVDVAALLRKSAAMEFLQKVREKRAAECFPEDCSSQVGESEEVEEVCICKFQTDCIVFFLEVTV